MVWNYTQKWPLTDEMEDKSNYPPPQYGVPPPQQVIISQPPIRLGPTPQRLTCPSCHAQIVTRVKHENTTKTHLFAVLLCLLFFPCVCLPYCIDSCKSDTHYCPQCGSYIGIHDK